MTIPTLRQIFASSSTSEETLTDTEERQQQVMNLVSKTRGKYHILEEIGWGSMGVVCKARSI